MKRAQYDNLPNKLDAVGNGSHIYRWDILQETNENGDVFFSCFEVVITKTPTADNVKEAAINATWGKDAELKMLNDYNAANEGYLPVSMKDEYLSFIASRNQLKSEIDSFFEK